MLLDRRSFLKSLGIIGGSSALSACTGAPPERLLAYLKPPREMTPGVASWYASVCRACPAGCGLLAKLREARPIKLEGNPHHPVNRGRLCPRGQTFLQGLYGRHRLKSPHVRKGGALVPVSWDVAIERVVERLRSARSTTLLTGLERGSFDDLTTDLATAVPGFVHLQYEPVALRSLAAAGKALFGREEAPRIDLSEADVVVSIGADFLDAWVSPVELSRQWADAHAFSGDRKRARPSKMLLWLQKRQR